MINRALVITFHGIRKDDTKGSANNFPVARYTIPADRFSYVLRNVQHFCCTTVSGLLEKKHPDCRVLTFDDGLSSDYEIAFPNLVAKGLTGTFFVTVGNVGSSMYVTPVQFERNG